jgi:hypothetical protein
MVNSLFSQHARMNVLRTYRASTEDGIATGHGGRQK